MIHSSETTPRERRREAHTERILDAAERLLDTAGPDGLTMQRLADAIGYTPGAMYRYFPSKEAIVAALQMRVFEALLADLEAANTAHEARATPLSRLCVVGLTFASLPSRRPSHAAVLSRWLGDPRPVLPAAYAEVNAAAVIGLAAGILERFGAARASGDLAEGEDAERALVLWASVQGLSMARKLERWQVPGLEVDRLVGRAIVALLVGWGADPQAAERALFCAAEAS